MFFLPKNDYVSIFMQLLSVCKLESKEVEANFTAIPHGLKLVKNNCKV